MTARPVTTTDLWKFTGLVLVLIDHWGLLFADDPSWRVVGRAAAPIFFFFIGLARTRRVPWSWVVLGLVLTAVRLALEAQHPHSRWVRNGLGAAAALQGDPRPRLRQC